MQTVNRKQNIAIRAQIIKVVVNHTVPGLLGQTLHMQFDCQVLMKTFAVYSSTFRLKGCNGIPWLI